jgi:hypothetical protein
MTNREIPQISVTGNANAEIEIKGLSTLSTIENPFFALGYKYKDVPDEEVELEEEDVESIDENLSFRLGLAAVGLSKLFKFFYLALRDEEVAFFVTDCVAQICNNANRKGHNVLYELIDIADRFDQYTEKDIIEEGMRFDIKKGLDQVYDELTRLSERNVESVAADLLENATNDYAFVYLGDVLILEHIGHLFDEAWFNARPTFNLLADETQQAVYKANLFVDDHEANEELIRFANPWNVDAKYRMRIAGETSQRGDRLFGQYVTNKIHQKRAASEFGDKIHETVAETIEQPRQKRKYTKRK